ncbi:MAG: hypothetical protein ACFFDK_01325 [Promethearchaeota archaeon]
MRKLGVCKFIFLVLLIQISLFTYLNPQFYVDNSSNPQQKRPSLKDLRNAAQTEYYEIVGTKNNTTSIQIELPDLTWNITEIKLNFTNISQYRQLRTIEGNITAATFRQLYKSSSWQYRVSYGQEIFFPEYTKLYGIYFYGFKTILTPQEVVKVLVLGFDDDTHIYNSTIYYNQTLNISNSLDWYFQDFSTIPKNFFADSYYFAIDGRSYIQEDPDNVPTYFFAFNGINPQYPSLYWGERDYFGFHAIEPPGDPFLIRLLEKVNRTYFPEEIQMQALIDNNYHNIMNETQAGNGNISLTNLNFNPDYKNFNIPISTNVSGLQLIYNVSFNIRLRKSIESINLGENNSDDKKNISIVSGISTEFFILIISIIFISLLGALSSYLAYKKITIKKEVFRKKIFNRYMDVLNLDCIIVSDKLSGLSIYEHILIDKKFDPMLVSGFLQAIRAFGLELSGSDVHSQTIKLEYQKSKILMSEYKNFRIINIFEQNPSKEFKFALESLSQDIDKYFGKLLKNFNGELTPYVGIKELLEKHLQISMLSPLKIVMLDEVKLNNNEKSTIKQASNNMKKKSSIYFYISDLITEQDFNPKRAEAILNLIKKKVFQPIL